MFSIHMASVTFVEILDSVSWGCIFLGPFHFTVYKQPILRTPPAYFHFHS
jgi:hypothetical protein